MSRTHHSSVPYGIGTGVSAHGSLGGFVEALVKSVVAVAPMVEVVSSLQEQKRHRRTDDEFGRDLSDTEKKATDFQCRKQVPLSSAVTLAQNIPGVYILYLDGVVMKCGRAAYGGGIAWRLRQYYNLNYDTAARQGNCRTVSKKNRDRVTVSWQCCPASKCQELEYKLFRKYGKGPWAERAPISGGDDSWDLLI